MLPQENAKNVPATVWKRGSGSVNATVYTVSQTVTLDGIPTESAGISAMTCTCSLPLIRIMTHRAVAKSGSWNTIQGLLWNAVTNVRKWTIN